MSLEQLGDHAHMQNWLAQYEVRLRTSEKSGLVYKASLREDRERNVWLPEVELISHGLSNYVTFNRDFFGSNDYKTVVTLGAQLSTLLDDGAYIQRGERKKQVKEFKEALDWLMAESTKRHTIQRSMRRWLRSMVVSHS